jgi:hypothetical protein
VAVGLCWLVSKGIVVSSRPSFLIQMGRGAREDAGLNSRAWTTKDEEKKERVL